jgi:hypothetical protein
VAKKLAFAQNASKKPKFRILGLLRYVGFRLGYESELAFRHHGSVPVKFFKNDRSSTT